MSDPADTAPPDASRHPQARAERFAKPLANHYRRWRRRFARRPNAIQTRAGSEPLDLKTVHSHWIVGRDLCLYRAEDFAAIPKNRRDAAVALRIPVWSPFEHTGHHCVWSGSTAMVWFWDSDAVDIHPADLGIPEPATKTTGPESPAARVRILPESVFQPRHGTGLRLQACASGFDLQYWHGGVLHDSLWLPDPPDAARIRAFTNQVTIAPDAPDDATPLPQEPEPSPASFSPDPWYSPLTPQAWLIANERTLVIAGIAFFAAVAAFEEARVWRYHFAHQAAAAELRQIDRELAPVLAARNELAAIDNRNAFLTELLNEPSQAALMLQVDRALPGATTQFQAWRYQQRDLSMTLSDHSGLDAVAVVAELQAEPLFKDVQPGRTQRDGTEITLRIDPTARQP
ncbi:MAG: hypothetical protein OXL38_04705 [Gammaproteobacteria bacterium]|nr:hypothetical protein [Gammaproteobacteria bacterium]